MTTMGEELTPKERATRSDGSSFLLSVHHDSVQPRFVTARKESGINYVCSDKASGFSIFISRLNPRFAESESLAKNLGEALLKRGLVPTLHHAEPIQGENRPLLDARLGIYQYDSLGVLKYAKVPALLLEAAVIVHPDDDRQAQSPEFQKKIADSVAEMAAGQTRKGGSHE